MAAERTRRMARCRTSSMASPSATTTTGPATMRGMAMKAIGKPSSRLKAPDGEPAGPAAEIQDAQQVGVGRPGGNGLEQHIPDHRGPDRGTRTCPVGRHGAQPRAGS